MTGKSDPRKYGYCRVSTPKQKIDRQVRSIKGVAPDAVIFKEVFTGTSREDRKEFMKLLKRVKPGDSIYFDSVSRMSRNAEEGFQDYLELYERGIHLFFIKESYINTDYYREALSVKIPLTDTPADILLKAVEQYMMELARRHIKAAFEASEDEVRRLRKRTVDGLDTARDAGKKLGRPVGTKIVSEKSIQAKEKIRRHSRSMGGSMTDKECMDYCNISHVTYYKYKKEIMEELSASGVMEPATSAKEAKIKNEKKNE